MNRSVRGKNVVLGRKTTTKGVFFPKRDKSKKKTLWALEKKRQKLLAHSWY